LSKLTRFTVHSPGEFDSLPVPIPGQKLAIPVLAIGAEKSLSAATATEIGSVAPRVRPVEADFRAAKSSALS